jgi:hypothetical protein
MIYFVSPRHLRCLWGRSLSRVYTSADDWVNLSNLGSCRWHSWIHVIRTVKIAYRISTGEKWWFTHTIPIFKWKLEQHYRVSSICLGLHRWSCDLYHTQSQNENMQVHLMLRLKIILQILFSKVASLYG